MFTFVLKDKGTNNQGWWLKVSSIKELQEYNEKTESPVIKEFKDVLNCRMSDNTDTGNAFLELYSQNKKVSPIEAVMQSNTKKSAKQIEFLINGFNIYFNRHGAWHFGKDDYDIWCHSDSLIFPDFKMDEIKIEKFPDGDHFYAYIGKMQVRDKNTLKWNTYEEAYAQALSVIGKHADTIGIYKREDIKT